MLLKTRQWTVVALSLAALSMVALPGVPRAAVLEPNGISVPAPPNPNGCQNMTCNDPRQVCSDGRCELSLQGYFDAEGEAIDALADAATEPGAFMPLCDFQVTLVLSESQAAAGLAWYNVPAAATGAPAAVYPIGPATLAVGQAITSADVRSNPAYTPNGASGGLIGFVLRKNGANVYFSEYQRNALCSGCATPERWKMALAYRSTRYPNAYYLAFEDWEGANDTTWFGNDGDFNDKVFRVGGVTCDGGGEPCQTTMPGICRAGVTECRVGGEIICKHLPPSPEICDNLDNDCDGEVDDGASCPPGRICDRGLCVLPCNDVEFPCDIGLVCQRGLCLDPACAGKTCGAGQVCRGGTCVGGCDGVVCPLGQECVASVGLCVDLCAGVSCPGGVCERGACVTSCACRGCPTGKSCAADGRCVDPGCDATTCAPGTVCRTGSCRDACAGAICPGGAACRVGQCDAPVPGPTPTGAAGGAGSGLGGAPAGSGGGAAAGRGGTLGTGGASGGGGTGGAVAPTRPSATCTCTAAESPPGWAAVVLLAFALRVRRRRRSEAREELGFLGLELALRQHPLLIELTQALDRRQDV